MPLPATLIWEIEAGGSDSANGGSFDPANANFLTNDLSATGGNSTTPVLTSGTYNFVAGDVGAWVFIAGGTNWQQGFYKIVSVAANKATVNAGIGAAVLYPSFMPNTVAGVASVASPSGATWGIDYSQQPAARFTYTDLNSTGAGNTLTSASHPFDTHLVGNGIQVAGGTTNLVAGFYTITSVSGNTATLTPAGVTTGAVTGTNANTSGLGGALASPGRAAGAAVTGNRAFIQSGTYNISSTSSNVANGRVTWPAGSGTSQGAFIMGYNAVRGDFGPRPILAAVSPFSGAVILTTNAGNYVANLTINGGGLGSVQGIATGTSGSILYRCKVQNCTNVGINNGDSGSLIVLCELTGCTGQPAGVGGQWYFSAIHDNTGGGLSLGVVGSVVPFCLVTNNTGAGTDGVLFASATSGGCAINTTAFNNGRDGMRVTAGTVATALINNLAVNNAAMNYDAAGNTDEVLILNNGWFGGGGGIGGSLPTNKMFGTVPVGVLPFVNAGGDNYALNSTAGGGAAAIAAGVGSGKLPIPGLSAASYNDLGAAQVPSSALLSTNQVMTLVDQTRQTVQFTVTAQTVNFGKPISSTTMINSMYDWANYAGLLWAGGRYTSGGPTNTPCLFNSPDGVNWKEQTAAVPFGSEDEVRTLFASADGNLYLGTTGAGGTPPTIYKYDGTAWNSVVGVAGQTTIRSMADGPDGLVYAGTTSPSGTHPVLLNGGAHTNPPQTWNTVSGTPWSLSSSKVDRVILANFLGPGGTMYVTTSDAQSGGTGGVFAATTTPSNGANWTLISPASGFSTPGGAAGGVEAHKMALFKGQYYTSTHDLANGASVWVSNDGGHTWTQVPSTAFGFGIGASEQEAYHLCVYDDTLFVGTLNAVLGGGLWYTQNGLDWFRLGSPGMGDPVNNSGYYHLIAFQNQLWVAPHGATVTSPNVSRPYSIQRFANTGPLGAGGAGAA
jgi:hypothetical protein